MATKTTASADFVLDEKTVIDEPLALADDARSSTPLPLPVSLREPAGGWPADEFTGLGGSYVRDPVTGLRRPAQASQDTPNATFPALDK